MTALTCFSIPALPVSWSTQWSKPGAWCLYLQRICVIELRLQALDCFWGSSWGECRTGQGGSCSKKRVSSKWCECSPPAVGEGHSRNPGNLFISTLISSQWEQVLLSVDGENLSLPAEGTARQEKLGALPAQSSQAVFCAVVPVRVTAQSGHAFRWQQGKGKKHLEGKGNGPVSPCLLCCPACVPGEEKGRRMCLTGKAAEGFPCCNQLSPGEKSRRLFDGRAIGLTEVSVPQLVLGPVARRWIRPSPSSFFPGILMAHPPAWPSRPASPTQ